MIDGENGGGGQLLGGRGGTFSPNRKRFTGGVKRKGYAQNEVNYYKRSRSVRKSVTSQPQQNEKQKQMNKNQA